MRKIPIHKKDILDKNTNPENPVKQCCLNGCEQEGIYPAPKPRPYDKERYWFCLNHIRQYNASWNYFDGMSPAEIEQHQCTVNTGHRPTWKMGLPPSMATDRILNKVFTLFSGEESVSAPPPIPTNEREALAVLDLTYPVTVKEIKARYKKLVKLHHPDVNNSDKSAQEKFIAINKAYTYLMNCGYFVP